MKDITPNLWFDGNAKEAVDFYVSVFPDSKIISTTYYPTEGLADFQKEMAGKELTVEYELSGNRFVAINAGPELPASEQCGWCKDQYGLSWQVVPENMDELMKRPNAFANMMKMHKIVIADF